MRSPRASASPGPSVLSNVTRYPHDVPLDLERAEALAHRPFLQGIQGGVVPSSREIAGVVDEDDVRGLQRVTRDVTELLLDWGLAVGPDRVLPRRVVAVEPEETGLVHAG